MQELNLDVAGEFLVMAATLIHIKSKMLLPRPETAAGVEGEEEDPRDALVRRLLEHQKFKAAAELLHEREQVRAAQWLRPDGRVAEIAGDDYEPELEVDLFSLLTAFQAVVERAKHAAAGAACRPSRSRSRRGSSSCSTRLSETEACGFEDLFADVHDRSGLIVTFLALARDDSTEAGAGLPVRQLRSDPRLQARAAGRRAASDWRSGETSWMMNNDRRQSRPGRAGGRGGVQEGAGASEDAGRDRRAQGDSRGADLRVARPADAAKAIVQAARLGAEGRRRRRRSTG